MRCCARADATLRDLRLQALREPSANPPRPRRRVTLSAFAFRAARRRLSRASARVSLRLSWPLAAQRQAAASCTGRAMPPRAGAHPPSATAALSEHVPPAFSQLGVLRDPLRACPPRNKNPRLPAGRFARRGGGETTIGGSRLPKPKPTFRRPPPSKSFTIAFVQIKGGPSHLSWTETRENEFHPKKPLHLTRVGGWTGGRARAGVGDTPTHAGAPPRDEQLFRALRARVFMRSALSRRARTNATVCKALCCNNFHVPLP